MEEAGEYRGEVYNAANDDACTYAAHTNPPHPPVLFFCFLLYLTDDNNPWVWYFPLSIVLIFPYIPSYILLFPLYPSLNI